MILITIDTTSRYGSVAVADGDVILSEQLFVAERSTAVILPQIIHHALQYARIEMTQLDGVGVATGPGSFTGLRVGVAAAKGLAYALNLPIVGFSSLAMLALNFPYASRQVCILHDARKREVYAGLYQITDHPHPIMAEAAMSPENLLQRIDKPTIFAGEGANVYRPLIEDHLGELAFFAEPLHSVPRPASAVTLARKAFERGEQQTSEAILPVYLRLSEAELSHAGNSVLRP